MSEIILQKLELLIALITNQSLLQKQVLNFNEACQYLGISKSHLYKLTSSKSIAFFCPQGKRLYFNRLELDDWLMRNRSETHEAIEKQAANYLINKGSTKP